MVVQPQNPSSSASASGAAANQMDKKIRKKRSPAADGAPRAPTPYNGFMKAELAKLKATQPEIHHRDAFKIAAERWSESTQNPKNIPGGAALLGPEQETLEAAETAALMQDAGAPPEEANAAAAAMEQDVASSVAMEKIADGMLAGASTVVDVAPAMAVAPDVAAQAQAQAQAEAEAQVQAQAQAQQAQAQAHAQLDAAQAQAPMTAPQ